MQLGGVAMAENTDQTVNIDKLVGLCSYVTMQKVLSEYYLTPVGESFRTPLVAYKENFLYVLPNASRGIFQNGVNRLSNMGGNMIEIDIKDKHRKER